jgi:hypothetical protein
MSDSRKHEWVIEHDVDYVDWRDAGPGLAVHGIDELVGYERVTRIRGMNSVE